MLTVFQCITMEGWTPILYWVSYPALQGEPYVVSLAFKLDPGNSDHWEIEHGQHEASSTWRPSG